MDGINIFKDPKSYFVSSFIPAAFFCFLVFAIFRQFIPSYLLDPVLSPNTNSLIQIGILLIITTWLGFTLYSGWNTTVGIFEGRYFVAPIRFLFVFPQKLFHKFRTSDIRKFQSYIESDNLSPSDLNNYEEQRNKAFAQYCEVEAIEPMNENELMPTRLGNVLAAAQFYIADRYHIENITIWSRLVHCFPVSFSDKVEEKNNQFIFLLNSSLLCFIMSFSCLLVLLLHSPCDSNFFLRPQFLTAPWFIDYSSFFCQSTPLSSFQQGFQSVSESGFIVLSLCFLISFYVLYRIAVVAAKAYTQMIRTGFDLYRLELLKKFNLPLPSSLEEEQFVWSAFCEFISCGSNLGKVAIKFNYRFDQSKKEEPDSSPDILVQSGLINLGNDQGLKVKNRSNPKI